MKEAIVYLTGEALQKAKILACDCPCYPMRGDDEAVGVCKECNCIVDSEGCACVGCSSSPEVCAVCGYRPCDGSC